jgi:hypothetical protein
LNNLFWITYILPETANEKEIEARWNRIEEKYKEAGDYFQKNLKKIREKGN